MSYFGKDNARSAHLYEVYQGKSVLIIVLHRDAGTSRYSFIWASPLAWLNSLSLVNNDGYYLTTAQKTKDNVFFNGTNVYPISFALAGAGMIAYAGEQPEKDVHFYTFALLQHNRKKHTFVNCTPPHDIQAVWNCGLRIRWNENDETTSHTPQGIVQDPMRRNVGFGNFQPERFLYYYAFN